jgi:transcriptional regulator with XRE-family HTH domain
MDRIPVDDLGTRLLLARRMHGLTVKEAAAQCGLNYGSWSTWERGARPRPRDLPGILDAISAGLNVDREWLANGGPLARPRPAGLRSAA